MNQNKLSADNCRFKLLTTNEAAAFLKLQPQTLRKWAMDGSGPIQPIKIQNRLRWRLSDMQELCK